MPVLDLARPGDLMLALGPDLVLSVGAMLLLLWAAWVPETDRHQRTVGAACMVLVVLTIGAVGYYMWRGYAAGPGPVAVDAFRWVADIIVLLGTLATIGLSLDYNPREGMTPPEGHVLVLLATSGMMLLAGARDLTIVFLGIELMSVS